MTITFDPMAGTRIEDACEEAVRLARKNDCVVEFDFNDVHMQAFTTDSASDVSARWHAETDRRRAEYESSPEYAKKQESRRIAVLVSQNEIDRIIATIDRISGEAEWMSWIKYFAELSDDVGVEIDLAEVSAALRRHGWVDGAHVGKPPGDFKNNKTMLAEYIMGQAINCLNRGMPPHPITRKFVDDYMAMA